MDDNTCEGAEVVRVAVPPLGSGAPRGAPASAPLCDAPLLLHNDQTYRTIASPPPSMMPSCSAKRLPRRVYL